MDKKDEVNQILNKIRETADEILEDENTHELTAQETVIVATELVVNYPITTIEYSQPIGIVDTTRVTFMLDDEFEFPLYGDEYEEES